MEVTFMQILAVSLFGGFSGFQYYVGQWNFDRPLVTGMIVGLILGDLKTGLIVGGTLEFMFLGAVAVGGAQPPNMGIAGLIGVSFAILAGLETAAAVALAFPFAVAMQGLITILITAMSFLMRLFDKAIDQMKPQLIERYYHWIFGTSLFVLYFVIVFAPLQFGVEAAQAAVGMMPAKVIHGLSVAGGMMPAIGFAILLNMIFKKEFIVFTIVGFVLASYLGLPILAIAALGFAVAVYDFYGNRKVEVLEKKLDSKSSSKVGEDNFEDGI